MSVKFDVSKFEKASESLPTPVNALKAFNPEAN